jgi:hypothetical protein
VLHFCVFDDRLLGEANAIAGSMLLFSAEPHFTFGTVQERTRFVGQFAACARPRLEPGSTHGAWSA